MGIGTSRVHPIKQTGLMANNIVVGRTSLAAVPTPTPTPRVPAESVNEAGAPIAPTSNGPCPVNPGAPVPTTSTPRTNYPVPPFGFNKFTFPSRQSNLVTPKVKINLRTPSCCLRRTTVRVQPKQNDISSSEVIHISDDSLKDGDMIVDTPTEKIFMSKVKRWQIFPGNTKFWFDGRFIHGPDRLTFYASFAVVQFIYGGFAAFVLPFLMEITPSFVLPVITAFSYNSVVSTMLYCAYTDPGIIPRATKSEIENYRRKFRESGFSVNLKEEINGKVILRKWCHTCLFYKPPRATHCRSCDTCVERFDHHCPFIGNCVGQRNYPTFFMFLVSVLISCLYVTGCCCGVIAYEYSNDVEKIYSPDKPTVASWIVGIASFAVFVAVGFLFGLHIGLISQDLTTNEDYKFDGRGDNNPYNQHSIWKNWCQVLLTPRLPTLIQRRAYVTKEFLESLYYQDAVNDAVSKKYGAAKDSPDPEPPYDPNRFKIKSNGKDGKPDYPRAHYHVYPPPGPPNNKDVANSPSTQMNNNASMNHQNHLGQGPNPSPADSQQVYTNSLINPNNWTEYSSQQQQESQRASGFQLELQNTEKFDSLSDTFNNSGGYPLAQVSIQDQDQQLSRQSSGPSLPFTISKETVLVERIFSTQLISPSPSQSFPGSNTETISLPINTTHLSSQSICRSFSCTQPTVVSYAGDFNKNPATNTYSSPTTDDIIIGVQIQTRESVRL